MERNKIYKGNVLDVIRTFPDNSIDCIVTSPPYWGPRIYGGDPPVWNGLDVETNKEITNCPHEWHPITVKGTTGGLKSTKVKIKGEDNFQVVPDTVAYRCDRCWALRCELGREPTPEEYIDHLMIVIQECRRVLKDTGTFWLNIGDTYYRDGPHRKSLVGIPQRIMIQMIDEGWICRNDNIWYKPDAMPHPVKDRFTPDLEHIYEFGAYFPFYSKNPKYYFNQLLDELKVTGVKGVAFGGIKHDGYGPETYSGNDYTDDGRIGKNKRTVWKISTANLAESHFAAYPEELARLAIEAGCPREICDSCGEPRARFFEKGEKLLDEVYEGTAIKDYEGTGAVNPSELKRRILDSIRSKYEKWTTCECGSTFSRGIVLDPFMGSGTTAISAILEGVDFIGIEYVQDYIDISIKRISDKFPNYDSRGAIREL